MKAGLIIWIFFSIPLFAVDFFLETSVLSGDVWRGLKYSDTAVFQPSLTVSKGGFSFEAWGSMDLSDGNDTAFEFTRADYTFMYHFNVEKLFLSGGMTAYTFPKGEEPSTQEVFFGVTFENRLNPTVLVYRDVDEVEGTFVQCGVFPSIPVPKWQRCDGIELSVMTSYGSGDYKMGHFSMGGSSGHGGGGHGQHGHDEPGHGDRGSGQGESGFLDLGIGIDLPIEFWQGILTFQALYVDLMDSEIHSPRFENDDSNFIFGLSYSRSF